MFKGKNILITGAYGFVGSNLTRRLIRLGAKVHVLVKEESDRWRVEDLLKNIIEHNIDLGDSEELGIILKKIRPHGIFHLAAYGSHYSQKDPEKIIETNLIGTINLFLALKDIDTEFLVNTGSSSEYGFKRKPMKEKDFLEPVSFYAAAKASCSLMGQVFTLCLKKPITTIRPFTIYGPYDTATKFIPTVIASCLSRKPLKMTPGLEVHDYVFIDDIIDAYLKAATVKKAFGQIINIGTGKQYTNNEIVQKTEKIAGIKILIERGAYQRHSWDTTYWVANNTKAKNILGWKPEYLIDNGLTKTINWFKENLNKYE